MLEWVLMKLYLLRHGKSEDDFQNRRQRPESELAEIGRDQAGKAGERLKGTRIDHIYSSGWSRARQTAEIVAEKLGREIEVFEGIHELTPPEELAGAAKDSEINLQFIKELGETDPTDIDWKFLNKGESIREVLIRASKFRDHLIEKHANQDILAVSHGYFISAFLAVAIWGDSYPEKYVRPFMRGFVLANTGLTIVEYLEDEKRWQLWVHNDHTHL